MNELREILYRLRKGESQREIVRALHLSRNTIRKYRTLAEVKGLLDPAQSLPDGQELVALPVHLPAHGTCTVPWSPWLGWSPNCTKPTLRVSPSGAACGKTMALPAVILRTAFPPTARAQRARGVLPYRDPSRTGSPGRLRLRRSAVGSTSRPSKKNLDVRDDPLLVPPSVCRVRLRPEDPHLAHLS